MIGERTSAMLATIENTNKAFKNVILVFNSTWIIDSSATNHMTFDFGKVSHLKQSSQKTTSVALVPQHQLLGKDLCPLLVI